MQNPVDLICKYHATRSFGSRENALVRSKEVNDAYRGLSEFEIAETIKRSLAAGDDLVCALVSLACLRPGSLKPFHRRFLEHGLVYPGVIYHDADEQCSASFADLIESSESMLRRNHLLVCMAWAGNAETVRIFNKWKNSAPAWAAELHVPPHAYAQAAGWELCQNAKRRDLFFHVAFPLVKPDSASEIRDSVKVGMPTDQHCQWCGRQLVSLLDIDSTSETVSFLRLPGSRLRVTTCDVCSCYGVVFSKHTGTTESLWHSANARPSYLSKNSADWDTFPERPMVMSEKRRHFMESANWTMVPGVAFSQIGGLPTWVQDAEYPQCPDCFQKMLFIGQISNEDFDSLMEGIEYCFFCPQCNVTATSYQQS